MSPKTGHWLIALAIAAAVHISMLAFFWRLDEPVDSANGILIEMGDTGGAAAGVSGLEALPSLEADGWAEAEPVQPRTLEPELVAEDVAAVTEANAPVDIELSPAERAALAKPDLVTRPKGRVKQQEKSRPSKRRKKEAAARRNRKRPQGTASTAAGGGAESATGKGEGRQGAGRGSAAAAAEAKGRYASQISAWLNRNKRYPSQARMRGQEGSVTVRFTVDRNGRVLSSGIVRSSGHRILDDEVRALLRRGRMPPMPAAMQQSRLTITVPIRFSLR